LPKVYYAVLKHPKKRTKEERITHLLILPNAENDFLYLGVTGKVTDEPGSYVTQLIVRFPQDLLNRILDGEAEQFGERYEVLEQIDCSVGNVGDECCSIRLDTPGQYIRSDLKISFKVTTQVAPPWSHH
jgi:hypothetical protein